MIEIRRFEDLGRFNNAWLNAHYHFSFGDYHDPARMNVGQLRVWNDDMIQPNMGFAPHSHQSMEIITYVRKGAITHTDSMGNKGRTEAGDVQVMSAGSGVQHSEWNAEPGVTELFQLWIQPRVAGGAPGWGARQFPKSDGAGTWTVFASGTGEAGSLMIKQDAKVMGATLAANQTLTYDIAPGRHGYLVIAAGTARLNGETLNTRDGAAINASAPGTRLTLSHAADAEIVLVDTV
jgi:quercetin 2,3-dioxygenase